MTTVAAEEILQVAAVGVEATSALQETGRAGQAVQHPMQVTDCLSHLTPGPSRRTGCWA